MQARAVVCIAGPFQIDGGLASPPRRSMRRAETSAETEAEGLVRDEVHLRSEKFVSVDRKLRKRRRLGDPGLISMLVGSR